MYRSRVNDGLSQAELEAARLGFTQYLRRKRFSPQFIAHDGEELFGQATVEYSRKLAEGVVIKNPPGWIIECAWRRTKSQLEAERNRPRLVSTERSGPLLDELGEDPEEALLDAERFGKVRAAVAELSIDRRRLLALSYFEGMPVREAARRLRWHASKAQRTHEGARRQLQELLGVQSSDELAIGLAAFLSLATERPVGLRLSAGVEAATETAARSAAALWMRTQELARRFLSAGGAEPASAALGGNAGRAAGVCAAATLACLASGVVGPGVGGLVGGGRDAAPGAPRTAAASHRAPPAASAAALGSAAKPEPTPLAPARASSGSGQHSKRSASTAAARSRRATHTAAAALGIESAAGPAETSSAPAPETGAPSSSSTTVSRSSPTPTEIATEQFGP